MKITQMEIKGFKSFDNVGQTININSFTSLIGGNGTGKTAVSPRIDKDVWCQKLR